MLPRSAGVYKIVCVANGRVYVGSSLNVYRRWHARHLPQLRRGTHINRHLQAAWNKYGEDAFQCELLEQVVDVANLVTREQIWINQLVAGRRGFNLTEKAGSTRGCRHTAAAKRKVGEKNSKNFIVRSPRGREQKIRGLLGFCRRRGLTHTAMSRVAYGKARHHRGWECRPAHISRREWLTTVTAGPVRPQMTNGRRKRCSRCKEFKPRSAFAKDKQTRTGLSAYCGQCVTTKNKAVYRRRVAARAA